MARAAATVKPDGGDERNAMSVAEPQAAVPRPSIRWYHLTPGRCLPILLVVEGLLWLSERFHWLPWEKGYAVMTAAVTVVLAMLLIVLWFGVALVFRRRFQFSIRSLLVLGVVVALPCSWLAVEMKNAREQKKTVAAIEKLGGNIEYDYESGQTQEPPGPAWLRRLLENDFFASVVQVDLNGNLLTDTGLKHIRGLKQLRALDLGGSSFALDPANASTDAGLESLEGLGRLEFLNLDHAPTTDAGLTHLKGLRQLRYLRSKAPPSRTQAWSSSRG